MRIPMPIMDWTQEKGDNTKIDFQIPTQIFLAYLKLFVHLTLNLEL